VLHDVFVYPTIGSSWAQTDEPGYMIEVDGSQATTLLAHLKRHKLRAKVVLRLLEEGELDVWSVWSGEEKWTPHSSTLGGSKTDDISNDSSASLSLTDTRASGMGQRLLLPSPSDHTIQPNAHPSLSNLDLTPSPLSAYTIRRYLRGVPEGPFELPHDAIFPMNANLDLMHAIDFKKGCYIGQELTIRTHHTGVVRRRILPVALYDAGKGGEQGSASGSGSGAHRQPPEKMEYDPETNVSMPARDAEIVPEGKKGRPGRWIAGVGNVGLAMCRLEMMTDLAVMAEASAFSAEDRFLVATGNEGMGEVGVKAFVPDWMRGRIRTPRAQKRVE